MGISSGNKCVNCYNKEMAKGWVGFGGSTSSSVAKIQSLKALSSCCEAFKIGSPQASNTSEQSWFFVVWLFVVGKGLMRTR